MTNQSIAWNRFGLGARASDQPPSDPKRWLLNQLDSFDTRPAEIAARSSSKDAIAGVQAYLVERRQMRRQNNDAGMSDEETAEARRNQGQSRRPFRQAFMDDVAARGLVSLQSATPFAERLVHFWSNHFAVSAAKRQIITVVGPHEFDAVRPNIMGSFRDLLRASALHPAMQFYLDQTRSIGPGSPAGTRARRNRGREIGINENLAREILELHTLGVRGGYSQQDVTEFARALTGWTLAGGRRARRAQEFDHGAAFVPMLHEPGQRLVLGQQYRDSGPRQALEILDDLAKHPATARHIATKLARHFAGDEPPAAMVARLQEAFQSSDGDLPTIYRAIVDSPEAWAAGPVKFRTPWEWAIASMRATDENTLNPRRFFSLLREIGQVPWSPTSPAGYDDKAATWAGPDALIRRIEASERLASANPSTDAHALAERLFPGTLNEHTSLAIRRAESGRQGLALLFASPDMMRR